MVVAAKYTPQEQFMTIPDEGWWQSVLAEEGRALAPTKHPAAKPEEKIQAEANALQPQQPDWEYAINIYKQDQIATLTVSGYNRGGLLVQGQNLSGFVPYSHLVDMTCETEIQRESFLAKFVGKEIRLKIIECIPEEGRIIFSERAARADAGKRTQIFTSLLPGQVVCGEVTNITDFGAFVDLGGVEGLIHISELSWGRVIHPSYILKLGENIKAQVIDIIPERCRIALSLKRLQPNPWETARQRFAVNDICPATITSVVSFGVFARLEDGLEGLAHVSEINLPEGQPIRNVFKNGQNTHVRILRIEPEHQRLSLSMKLDNI